MHLTETALINVTDNILKAIDEKSALLPVLLDMSKAFDNLNYNLLSKKLRKLGLIASLTSRFSSYLYIQQISKSTIQILSLRIVTLNKWSTSGINLGSCVITHSQPTTYVDDSKLQFKYSVRDSPSAMAAVNQDLRNMSKWCAESSLLIDPEKTKLDNLLGGYFISPYPCQDKTITPVSFAKDLRVYIDQYLTYNVHITKPASGCMNQLVPKSRIEHLLDKKTLLLLTNSFVLVNYSIVPQCRGTHLNIIYTNCSQYKIFLPELYQGLGSLTTSPREGDLLAGQMLQRRFHLMTQFQHLNV